MFYICIFIIVHAVQYAQVKTGFVKDKDLLYACSLQENSELYINIYITILTQSLWRVGIYTYFTVTIITNVMA